MCDFTDLAFLSMVLRKTTPVEVCSKLQVSLNFSKEGAFSFKLAACGEEPKMSVLRETKR